MKNNSKHLTLVIFGIISIFAAAFGYWYLHLAVITQAETYSLALKDAETYNENKKNEQSLQKIYNQSIADRAKINSYIVTEDKIIDFIESIENIGKITNTTVSLSAINSKEMDELSKGASGHIQAKVEIIGSWTGVMTALSLLENLPFSLSLQNSHLFKDSGTGKTPTWNLLTDVRVLSIK